jgi:pilus assembly protein Flp/PilA
MCAGLVRTMKSGEILTDRIRQLLRDEKGTMAIEYALIAGIMCAAIAAAVAGIGSTVNSFFTAVLDGFH